MEDEVEDGEIRSPATPASSPEKEDRPSSGDQDVPRVETQKVPVHEKSPSFEKADNERLLYDERGGLHGESTYPREYYHNNERNKVLAAEKVTGGPNLQEERGCNFVDQINQFGPTPISGLGKRSRDVRSPPSSGSMQGPPNRAFAQDPPAANPRFDLNRPSYTSDSLNDESPGF
ncbi:hypothetical protein Hanom_Chr01g00006941 [Helianthus anomalus]